MGKITANIEAGLPKLSPTEHHKLQNYTPIFGNSVPLLLIFILWAI